MKFLQVKPSIEVFPDSTVLVGSNVTLLCTLHIRDGDKATVKWTNTAQTTLINCNNETVTNKTTICNLTLESVNESSGGKYTCAGFDGLEFFANSKELHVVPYPTIELRDSYTGHQFDKIETGPVCVPTTESLLNCTVHNITYDASNITWTINGDEVYGEEVDVTSTVTMGNGTVRLSDMRSSLYLSGWADEYQDQVINVTCHFSGYKNIDPLEVTAQIKLSYDISSSLLIGLVTCHVTFAILAIIFVIIVIKCDDHHALQRR